MKMNKPLSTSEKLGLFYDIIRLNKRYRRILIIALILYTSYSLSWWLLLLFIPFMVSAILLLYLHENLKLNEKDYKITKAQFKKNYFKRKYLEKNKK